MEIANDPAPVIVSDAAAVCEKPPPVPVIVNGYVPAGSDASVRIAREDVLLAGFGENAVAVAPAGKPLTVKVTEPEKPFNGLTVTT